jgi:chemosensory pili system protein ChpA (sensor histidine kinase/response regulator)
MGDPGARERGETGMSHDSESRPRGSESVPLGPSVSTIRDLFRVEARELLAGMSTRLSQIAGHEDDRAGLAEIAARGHALKGSAALAELPYLSRAGAILQRAAELALGDAQRNRDAAQDLVRATREALGPAQRMLEDCLEGTGESQERLLGELLDVFSPATRAALAGDVSREEAAEAAMPDFEELVGDEDDLVGGDDEALGDAFAADDVCASPLAGEPPLHEAFDDDGDAADLADDDAESDGDEGAAEAFDPELAAFLAETFQQELRELLGAVPEMLGSLADPAQQANLCADLGRIFHTVKGSAATVGRNDLRDVGKTLQDEFDRYADESLLPLPPEFIQSLSEPIETVFLAAGLEPPMTQLEVATATARAFLADDEDDAAPVTPEPGADDVVPLLADDAAMPADDDDDDPDAPPQIEPEMMEAFTLDADAALSSSETALLYLERNPRDRTQLRALFRHFHTLKGAAAAVGLTRIAEQLHAGETLLETVIESPVERSPDKLIELLLELVDSVAGLLAQVRGVPHEHHILHDVEARVAEVLGDPSSTTAASGATSAAAIQVEAAHATPASDAPTVPAPPTDLDSAIVRVHASRLDLLMNRVSELVVSRTRIEDSMSAIYELKDKLRLGKLQIHEAVEGFRGFEFNPAQAQGEPDAPAADDAFAFSELEFDKYDDFNVLTRTLVELASDAGEIVEQLGGMIDAIAEESRQVSKVTSSLQRTITGMRLLSIDTLLRRLQRPIRDAARQTGKQIDLKCVGGEVQVDRAVIEALYGPLLHLVRNSVSHGIEAADERRTRGKAEVGTIELRAVQRHGSVEVTVRDDGRGLDFAAIRAKAERLGLISPSETLSRDELAKLIFRPGFSTQSRVTDLAGRGIGMDVVMGEVEQLRGTVGVESQDGRGAAFTIRLPLAAMIDQVLLLRAGTQVYALSQGPIESVFNVEPELLRDTADGLLLKIGDDHVPALSLPMLTASCAGTAWQTGRNDDRTGRGASVAGATAVVLRGGEHRMVLLVDRIEAQREAVVRPLGRLFAGHPFLNSATFAGDGQVIFVLDVARLADLLGSELARAAAEAAAAKPDATEDVAEDQDGATVLWADDSISVRKLGGHFLAAEGFSAQTAVDGRDALEKLRRGRYRVLVTDLEMPRMHGYELLSEIRSDPSLSALPVIVCSSRSSEKHRRRAQEAGANGYLTKPFTQASLAAALRDALT